MSDDESLAFLRALWNLDHRLQSRSKRMRKESGVTGPQRLVLRLLFTSPDTPPSAVARSLYFDRSTVTVILHSLEREGLVRRAPHPTDKRVITLKLTAKGRRIAEQRSGTIESVIRKTIAELPSRDVAAARRVLEALADAFE